MPLAVAFWKTVRFAAAGIGDMVFVKVRESRPIGRARFRSDPTNKRENFADIGKI